MYTLFPEVQQFFKTSTASCCDEINLQKIHIHISSHLRIQPLINIFQHHFRIGIKQ